MSNFHLASLESAINAFAAAIIMLASQYGNNALNSVRTDVVTYELDNFVSIQGHTFSPYDSFYVPLAEANEYYNSITVQDWNKINYSF